MSGQTVSLRRRELRFTLFVITLLGQYLAILAISTLPIPQDEARELRSLVPPLDQISAIGIFLNNVRVGFPAFVPALGVAWLGLITLTTGLIISAIGITNSPPVPGWLLWFTESWLPFFWLELMGYAVAVSAGSMLLLTVIFDRKRWKREVALFFASILTFVLLLWDAADIEYFAIVSTTPATIWLPLLDWITNLTVGIFAVWAYSRVYGPRLRTIQWGMLLGLTVLIVVPLVYMFIVLAFILYLLWSNPVPAEKPESMPPSLTI